MAQSTTQSKSAELMASPPEEPSNSGTGNQFIGVPDDFLVHREVGRGPSDSFEAEASRRLGGAPVASSVEFIPPRYKQGDEIRQFANRSRADRAGIQQALALTGFIGPRTRFQPGEWDGPTASAMKQVLSLANRTGSEWLDVLEDAVANPRAPGGGGGDATFVAEPFLPPDPVKLRRDVKKVIADATGRPESQIGDDEIEALLDRAIDLTEEGHAAQQDQRRVAFEAQQGNQAQHGIASEIDPGARFQAEVEERYAPEIARNRDRTADKANGELLMASMLETSEAFGG